MRLENCIQFFPEDQNRSLSLLTHDRHYTQQDTGGESFAALYRDLQPLWLTGCWHFWIEKQKEGFVNFILTESYWIDFKF